MTDAPTAHPTWDDFADHVLPWIGSPSLEEQIQRVAPGLTSKVLAAWATQFNEASAAHAARFDEELEGWTDEEIDGLWYDEMKSISLACISQARMNSPHP